MTLHGKLWYTMVYLFPNTLVFYHGFPVSKHNGLPWFPWYIVVFYHGLPVTWYTMAFTMVFIRGFECTQSIGDSGMSVDSVFHYMLLHRLIYGYTQRLNFATGYVSRCNYSLDECFTGRLNWRLNEQVSQTVTCETL